MAPADRSTRQAGVPARLSAYRPRSGCRVQRARPGSGRILRVSARRLHGPCLSGAAADRSAPDPLSAFLWTASQPDERYVLNNPNAGRDEVGTVLVGFNRLIQPARRSTTTIVRRRTLSEDCRVASSNPPSGRPTGPPQPAAARGRLSGGDLRSRDEANVSGLELTLRRKLGIRDPRNGSISWSTSCCGRSLATRIRTARCSEPRRPAIWSSRSTSYFRSAVTLSEQEFQAVRRRDRPGTDARTPHRLCALARPSGDGRVRVSLCGLAASMAQSTAGRPGALGPPWIH